MKKTIEKSVLSRIYGNGRGWAFSQNDFADLGSRTSIDLAMHRLAKKKIIRRVIRGIYDYPRFSELFQQEMGPSIHQVGNALARKFGWRIQPDGAAAMNLIGISNQVPSQYVFQSDGPGRNYKVGKTALRFKHAALKDIGFRHDESGIIVHAIKNLGEDRITDEVLAQIRQWLPVAKRNKVLKDTERVTNWVYTAIKQICRKHDNG